MNTPVDSPRAAASTKSAADRLGGSKHPDGSSKIDGSTSKPWFTYSMSV